MLVDNFKFETNRKKVRLSAQMTWEDCDRPDETIYFETDENYSKYFSDNANAFLLSTAIPAWHYGERRLKIKGEVCPELVTGMGVAIDWFRYWYYKNNSPKFIIETDLQQTAQKFHANGNRRAGFFFSGGVDSYAVLCANRRNFSPQHPGYIKDGILIFGLELDQEKKFEYVQKMLMPKAAEFNLDLIPIFTNIYLIYRQEDKLNSFKFWNDKFHSAALTAAVHALDKRFHTVSLGSTHDIPNLIPHGTHPVIEPNYSSALLRIKFDGVNLSRYEKTKLIAEYDKAVKGLRVCNHAHKYEKDKLNCGICDKCVRTALALEALGKLKGNGSFPYDRVEVTSVNRAFRFLNDVSAMFLMELIEPLKKAGRHDLAHAVRTQWVNYQNQKKTWRSPQRIIRSVKSWFKKKPLQANEKLLT